MKRAAWLAAALLAAQPAFAAVQAGDYRQFWLWAGVRAQPEVLRRAQTLYVLPDPDDIAALPEALRQQLQYRDGYPVLPPGRY